jgi:hypothetical protein
MFFLIGSFPYLNGVTQKTASQKTKSTNNVEPSIYSESTISSTPSIVTDNKSEKMTEISKIESLNRNLVTSTHRTIRTGKFIEENHTSPSSTKDFVNIPSKLRNAFYQEYVVAKDEDWVGVLSTYFRTPPGENINEAYINPSPNLLSPKLFHEDLLKHEENQYSKFNDHKNVPLKTYDNVDSMVSQAFVNKFATKNLGYLCDSKEDLSLDETNFAETKMTLMDKKSNDLRSKLLNELIHAGHELEDTITKIGPYLDGKMFDLLDRRLKMADAMGDKTTARTLVMLSQRLNAAYSRATCSKTILLLDECLINMYPLLNSIEKINITTRRDLLTQVTFKLSRSFLNHEAPITIASLSFAIAQVEHFDIDQHETNGISKEKFVKELMLFYENSLVTHNWKIHYHRQVEVIAKINVSQITNNKRRTLAATRLVNKRQLLNRHASVIHQIARVLEIAKHL